MGREWDGGRKVKNVKVQAENVLEKRVSGVWRKEMGIMKERNGEE